MSSGTPFIGSKISLISRAEIRYEGILYQVDTKESTVTLAKVRSFGTEGRESAKHIPPRSEVYEFIIFRASDIKDLNVSEMPEEPNSPPQDPAILSAQSSAPAPIPPSTMIPTAVGSSQPTRPPPHSVPPAHAAPYFTHPPMPPGGYTPFGMPYYRPPPVMMGTRGPPPVPQTMPMQSPMQSPMNTTSQGAPPQSVPSHVSVIGAPPAQSFTPPRSVPGTTTASPALIATPTYAPGSVEAKPQASSTPVVSVGDPIETSRTFESVLPAVSAPAAVMESENMNHVSESLEPHPSSQPQSEQAEVQKKGQKVHDEITEKQKSRGRGKPERGEWRGSRGNRGYSRGRRDYNHRSEGEGNRRGYNHSEGGDGNRGGGGRYRQQGGRGGYNRRQQQTTNASAKPTSYKYDSDFDFESANARFSKETLEKEFKEKLRVDSRKSSESYGEGEEGSPGSDEEVIVEEQGDVIEEVEEYYDKSKSFFDNISCEASTAKQRQSRNEEREVNMETFGVSGYNNRGYRYRRGGGRLRGRGGYRGGRNRYGGSWNNEGSGRNGYSRDGGRDGYSRDGGRDGYSRSGRRASHNYQNRQHGSQAGTENEA